jgi:hypothetical protein
MKGVRFLLSRKAWRFVEDEKVLFWLKLHRSILLSFSLLVMCGVVYLFVAIGLEVFASLR